MNEIKKIIFLTGTRADYGKMKSLMLAVEANSNTECHVFVTGMHTLSSFGDTRLEVIADGYSNIHVYMNQIEEEPMDLVLANTINGFSRYVRELKPDLIVVHGDRVEALAGTIVGALNNILVAHIEGGEVSGTIDESIRHSVTKLAHIHFVSNEDAKRRLIQLGECESSIYVIGSPDIDIINGASHTDISFIKNHYGIPFDDYAILMYHPVTTEIDALNFNVNELVSAVIASGDNFVVVQPNNDNGHSVILEAYKRFVGCSRFRLFPSIRFEYFIELIRHSKYIIGNSSAGIHEAPVMGVPSISVGTRQSKRFTYKTIFECDDKSKNILDSIRQAKLMKEVSKTDYFGKGNSKEAFMEVLSGNDIWGMSKQKFFVDY